MKKKRVVNVRIFTERMGLPFPFSPFFPSFDDSDDSSDGDEPESGEASEPYLSSPAELADVSEMIGSLDKNTEPERSEFFAEGRMVLTDDRVDVVYEETVLTGMEGSVTSIGFARSDPSVVTMLRQGFVNTAFVFEEGKRHICVYNTPFSSFEICVHALKVQNSLLENGTVELDYLSELRGARTERCKMKIVVE